jgi:hypothetical protein
MAVPVELVALMRMVAVCQVKEVKQVCLVMVQVVVLLVVLPEMEGLMHRVVEAFFALVTKTVLMVVAVEPVVDLVALMVVVVELAVTVHLVVDLPMQMVAIMGQEELRLHRMEQRVDLILHGVLVVLAVAAAVADIIMEALEDKVVMEAEWSL